MGPRALAAVAVVAMPGCLSKPEPPGGGDGWLPGYAYRRPIAVATSADLADFPLSVLTPGDPDLAMFADDTGQDLVFTAGDGTTVLGHEIVSFDGDDGALDAWVAVPAIAAPGTTVYLYYGGPRVPPAPAAAWPGYAAVWHMAETGPMEPDRTGQGHSLAALAGEDPASEPGLVGRARRYNGGDHLCSGVPGLPVIGTGSFTFSVLIQTDEGSGDFDAVFNTGGGDSSMRGYSIELGLPPWDVNFADGTNQVVLRIDDPAIYYDEWLHVVAVADRETQTAHLYINTVEVDADSIAQLGSLTGSQPVCLGGFYDYVGFLDEARILPSAMTPARVFAEHANLVVRSSFVTIGAAETAE